jgi:hypothetical protein
MFKKNFDLLKKFLLGFLSLMFSISQLGLNEDLNNIKEGTIIIESVFNRNID